VSGVDLDSVENRYDECFEIEGDLTLELRRLLKLAPGIFQDFASEADAAKVSVPANLLRLVAKWADSVEWEQLAGSYLSAIERLASPAACALRSCALRCGIRTDSSRL